MAASLPIVCFDYDFSPYTHKIRFLLKASGVPYKSCKQPVVLPRPDLQKLGITYRLIPVLSIGKDVYCDTGAIIPALQRTHKLLKSSVGDKGFDLYGSQIFARGLPCAPGAFKDPNFVKDRETIFPALKSPQFAALKPSALAEVKSHIKTIEDDLLGSNPFIGGNELSMADIHVSWSIRWLLFDLKVGREPGFGKDAHPKLYKWFEALPSLDTEAISGETAHKTILESSYVSNVVPFDDKDPLGIAKGTNVIVESRDAKPGAHPQAGKLLGLSAHELVLQLDNGIRLHFPRAGYAVFESSKL